MNNSSDKDKRAEFDEYNSIWGLGLKEKIFHTSVKLAKFPQGRSLSQTYSR
jgi:hypothetical protein